jgi:hypothetical protein
MGTERLNAGSCRPVVPSCVGGKRVSAARCSLVRF